MVKEYLISDFLKRIKRPIVLEENSDYKLVTIKMNHKGVTLREIKKGFEIKSNMYLVKEGDFILSGIDARNGAFGIIPSALDNAIVTNDFWYFEIDENIILKELFLELTATNWFDEICKKGSDGTTQRIRLQKDKFFNQSVWLPEKSEQQDTLAKLKAIKEKLNILTIENLKQSKLNTSLKQSILQEAIEGKLTINWRNENTQNNSANQLLTGLRKEKENLIKEKIIKKDKPFPIIKKNEIPFELPENWVWCRFGEIATFQIGKTPASKQSNYWSNGTHNWLSISDMEEYGNILRTSKKITDFAVSECFKTQNIVPVNTLLMSFKLTVGRVSINKIPLYHNEAIVSIFPFTGISQPFLFRLLPAIIKLSISKKVLMGQTFNSSSLANLYIPLPPTNEQNIIVEKVELMMDKFSQLSKEIETLNIKGKNLLKAMFNETFETLTEVIQE